MIRLWHLLCGTGLVSFKLCDSQKVECGSLSENQYISQTLKKSCHIHSVHIFLCQSKDMSLEYLIVNSLVLCDITVIANQHKYNTYI